MTTMAMTESLDAPMMDFSGEDIPMQTSSSTGWVHPEATMDDDSNLNPDDVEIDMDYHQETFEYEMADDSAAEVHDVEVIDVSQAHTPALIDTVVEDATVASPAVPEHDLTDTHDRSPLESPPTLVIQVPSPTPQPAQDEQNRGIIETETLEQSEWDQSHSELVVAPSSPHRSDRHQSQTKPSNSESSAEPFPTWDINVPIEPQSHPTPPPVEQRQPESSHEEPPNSRWGGDKNPAPSRASSGDPHEVSDGIFIDPPPPVILFLGDLEEEYYLFNHPIQKSPTADDGAAADGSLFLHDFPTLYYEPLAKVFQALRSDDRLVQHFDLSRGELVIDAYDLVDLVISEDNSYTNEVSFHDLNLLHDHADLAGPLRIRIRCNPRRFIARYRELKSKLEQFNLLDEASADYAPLQEDYDSTEHHGVDDSGNLAQHEEGGNLASSGQEQPTTERQANDLDSAPLVDHFDEGEPSNDAEPEQARLVEDEESTVGVLSDDERTDQPVGAVEDDREPGAAVVTGSDDGPPGTTEDLDAAAIQGRSDDRSTPPLGEISTEYDEVVATNEDYEADYDEDDQDGQHADAVAIEGDARDADWETTASDAQNIQDDLERHDNQDGAEGTDRHSDIIDLTAPNLDDDHTGQPDTDTDSIGQRTLDEFADAQKETRDGSHTHEGEESNSTTDQSNDLNPDLDQFGDQFNWDEDFGGDFDGEFDELEDESNTATKRVHSQEPASEKSSKRGFDEVDSDTADDETSGDASPNSKRKKVL